MAKHMQRGQQVHASAITQASIVTLPNPCPCPAPDQPGHSLGLLHWLVKQGAQPSGCAPCTLAVLPSAPRAAAAAPRANQPEYCTRPRTAAGCGSPPSQGGQALSNTGAVSVSVSYCLIFFSVPYAGAAFCVCSEHTVPRILCSLECTQLHLLSGRCAG